MGGIGVVGRGRENCLLFSLSWLLRLGSCRSDAGWWTASEADRELSGTHLMRQNLSGSGGKAAAIWTLFARECGAWHWGGQVRLGQHYGRAPGFAKNNEMVVVCLILSKVDVLYGVLYQHKKDASAFFSPVSFIRRQLNVCLPSPLPPEKKIGKKGGWGKYIRICWVVLHVIKLYWRL